MRGAHGTFLGVRSGWQTEYAIDEAVLKAVYADVRRDAKAAGCAHYPGRDDLASSEVLFLDVVRRYETAKAQNIPLDRYPHFRRWLLLLFKGGDMPA
jgi:hypothetical protein